MNGKLSRYIRRWMLRSAHSVVFNSNKRNTNCNKMMFPVILLSLLMSTNLSAAASTTTVPSPTSEEEHQTSSTVADLVTAQNKAKRQLYHLTYDHPDPYQDETTFYASKQLQQAAASPQQQPAGLGSMRLEPELRARQPVAPVYQLRTNYLNIVPPNAPVQKPQIYSQQTSQLPSIVVPVTQQPIRQLPKYQYQLPAATYKPLAYYNLQQYHAPTYQKIDGTKPIALESQTSCAEKSNNQAHLQPQQQVVEEQYEQSPPSEYPAAMLVNLGTAQGPKSEALVQQGPHLAPIHVYQAPNGQYKIAPQLYGGPQLFKQNPQQIVPAVRFHYLEHPKKSKPVQVVLRKKNNEDEEEEVVPEKKSPKKKYEEVEEVDDSKKHHSDDDDDDDSKSSYEKTDNRGRSSDDSFKPSKHYPYDEDRKYSRKHHSKSSSGEFTKHYGDDDDEVIKSKPSKSSDKNREYRKSSSHRSGNNDGDETKNVEVYKENPVPILQKMLPTEFKQKKVYRENWYITKSIQN